MRAIDHFGLGHQLPVSYSSLPVADSDVSYLDNNDPHFLACDEVTGPSILTSITFLPKQGCSLLKRIIL